jgi:hypothetical protein
MPALITVQHLFPARFGLEKSETRMISGRVPWVLEFPVYARVRAIEIFPDDGRTPEG